MFAALLPELPGWNHLHPMVVHFPIALLMVAPLFVLGGLLVRREKGRPYFIAGFLLLLMGTCGTFLAGATGDAASEAANKTSAINAVLERHEEMADASQIVFSGLTVGLAMILFLPKLLRREPAILARVLPALFLVLYLGGIGVLVNTAHNGGRLVHELGIHGPAPASGTASAVAGHNSQDRE